MDELTPTEPQITARARAPEILREAAQHIEDRADQRDCPGGERSMARTVALFNALTGHTLSVVDGWQFAVCLKLARSRAGRYVGDDYVDCVAYAALAAEAAAEEHDGR